MFIQTADTLGDSSPSEQQRIPRMEIFCNGPALLYTFVRGRPRVDVHPDAWKFLLEFGFNTGEIATMFSVSTRAIKKEE